MLGCESDTVNTIVVLVPPLPSLTLASPAGRNPESRHHAMADSQSTGVAGDVEVPTRLPFELVTRGVFRRRRVERRNRRDDQCAVQLDTITHRQLVVAGSGVRIGDLRFERPRGSLEVRAADAQLAWASAGTHGTTRVLQTPEYRSRAREHAAVQDRALTVEVEHPSRFGSALPTVCTAAEVGRGGHRKRGELRARWWSRGR